MEKRYPMAVKLEVYITDGEQVGSVNYGYGFGGAPSDEDMKAILPKVKSALPPGFRLMNRGEAAMHFLREEKGYRGPNLHMSSEGNWHDPATDTSYSDLNDEPEEEVEY